MNQEIKLNLDKAAEKLTSNVHLKAGFVHGAQTILENPGEWGLVNAKWKEDAIYNADTGVEIAAERDKYREALEKLLKEDMCSYAGDRLIKEALKQEVNND
ncbi:hypothetical protein [Parapedobacter lycopersici]|uniref:hypothetical protein n=1 Tax=Parapedobacter lycopersici TaxID=1864939 RepID=UPI00214D87C5|nr:hypothetical protein [Parapedobacter lycopersici]